MKNRKLNSVKAATALVLALSSSQALPSAAFATKGHSKSAPAACTITDVQLTSRNADLSQAVVTLKSSAAQKNVTCDVSLNSYKTDGPTWPTSGIQALIDHKTVTLTKTNASATLTVQTAPCYGQNDLYIGSQRFDGVDGPLPKYPNAVFPSKLITAWNGGKACVEVTPPAPTFNDMCGTDQDKYIVPAAAGVKYQINGQAVAAGTYAGTGSITITAVAKPGYTLAAGNNSWTFHFANEACPTPNITVSKTECVENGVKVTLTNSGDADGKATINGKEVTIAAGKTVATVLPLDAQYSARVKVVIDGAVVIEKTITCAPAATTTTETPHILAASTTAPASLPATGSSTSQIVTIASAAAAFAYGLVSLIRAKFATANEK